MCILGSDGRTGVRHALVAEPNFGDVVSSKADLRETVTG